MNKAAAEPKKHHYVPRFLISNFSIPEKKSRRTYVFDLISRRTFRTSVENVGAETHFNRLEGSSRMEQFFSIIENRAASAFYKLITQKTINCLNEHEVDVIMRFIISQYIRTRAFREQIKDFDDQIERKLRTEGADDETISKYIPMEREEAAKLLSFKLIFDLMKMRHELLLSKVPILFSANEGRFILSDNPVLMHNVNDFRPYGNLGFLVQGIQIYIPISPKYCFAYYCSSNVLEMQKGIFLTKQGLQKAKATRVLTGIFNDNTFNNRINELDDKLHRLRVMYNSIELGGPVAMNLDNVTFVNSLSIASAERQVYAIKRSDLALATEIAQDNPDHAAPPRLKLQ